MNERLKELAVQAGYEKDMFGIGHWDMPECQKFAELIVAECLRQVREQYKPVLEDDVMMKDTHWDGYVQCGVDSYVAIKEHFGVSND
jgi:CTP:phosphocholine cytidylyltransferase-like protein